jgi:tricorn protease-like protein
MLGIHPETVGLRNPARLAAIPRGIAGRSVANPIRPARTLAKFVLLGSIVLAESGALAQQAPASKGVPPANVRHRNARAAISANGNVAVFQSTSKSIVSGDTSGIGHVYARDLTTGTLERISTNGSGKPGDKQSFGATVSADGRYVAFSSGASNLVRTDTNEKQDVFIKDRKTGEITRISKANSGIQANQDCRDAVISPDGKFVVFISASTTLVEEDNNKSADVFLYDVKSRFIRRVSVTSDGQEADHGSGEPAISADGRFVAFYTHARNLDARDTNNTPDIYVHDTTNGRTEMVSVASNAMIGNRNSHRPSISDDGRFVVFESWASNLVSGDTNRVPDVFLRDRKDKKTVCISLTAEGKPGNDDSRDPRIAGDGRTVVYASYATNLVPGDTNNLPDIFVFDRKSRKTERVNLSYKGEQANNRSGEGFLSGDGRMVVFTSKATNLIEKDDNKSLDIFVVDRQAGKIRRASEPAKKTAGS